MYRHDELGVVKPTLLIVMILRESEFSEVGKRAASVLGFVEKK